jgi:hypothetical protein
MIGEAATSGAWFEDPVSLQRPLVFIIMRTQRPVVLSVGPFGALSLELYGRVSGSLTPFL